MSFVVDVAREWSQRTSHVPITCQQHWVKRRSVSARIQNFFCTTLAISKKTVQRALSNRTDLGHFVAKNLKRNKRPKNKTSHERSNLVHQHILSFHCVESLTAEPNLQLSTWAQSWASVNCTGSTSKISVSEWMSPTLWQLEYTETSL